MEGMKLAIMQIFAPWTLANTTLLDFVYLFIITEPVPELLNIYQHSPGQREFQDPLFFLPLVSHRWRTFTRALELSVGPWTPQAVWRPSGRAVLGRKWSLLLGRVGRQTLRSTLNLNKSPCKYWFKNSTKKSRLSGLASTFGSSSSIESDPLLPATLFRSCLPRCQFCFV